MNVLIVTNVPFTVQAKLLLQRTLQSSLCSLNCLLPHTSHLDFEQEKCVLCVDKNETCEGISILWLVTLLHILLVHLNSNNRSHIMSLHVKVYSLKKRL